MKANQLWLVIALVAAAGCAQLPDVEGNVCGNGVLETGEDCEGPMLDDNGTVIGQCGDAGGDNGCFFECVPGENEVCPPGYGCGIDGRCRQPSGRLTPGASMTLAADQLSTGDVDGDGYADLIAASGTSVEIDFGSAQADFSSSVETLVATPERGVQVGDLDRDGADDVLVGTTPGIQTLLGAADRALDPFSYPIAVFTPDAAFTLGTAVDVDSAIPDDEVVLAWADQFGFPVLSPTARMTLPGLGLAANLVAPLEAARLGALRGTGTPPEVQDPTVEVALGYGGGSNVFIVEASGNPLAVTLHQTIVVGEALHPASGMFFGFWNADNCIDLIAHAGAVDGHLVLFRNDCAGNLQPPIELTPFALTDRLLGAADFDRDGVTDLVTNRGVFRVTGTGPWTLTQIAVAGGIPYEGAQVVDINGDGFIDVAAFRESQPDVDVLINATGGVFNRFVVATADPVQRLAAGDFDGDLTPDLAMVELESSGQEPIYVISVSFGQFHGPPGARVVMDHFDAINGFVSASLVGATGEPDAVSDLVCLENNADEGTLEASVLFGSGARSMNSPLTLQSAGVQTPDAFLLGQFDEAAGLDLFAVGHLGTAFLFSGDGNSGELVLASSAPWPGATDLKDTAASAGDVDGDGVSEIAVAERHSFGAAGGSVHVLLFAADPTAIPVDAVLDEIEGFIGTHAVRIADFDGDGDNDLMVTLDPIGDDIAGTMRIGWNHGGVIDALTPVSGADGCIDAVLIDLDSEPQPELAVLCRDEGGGRDNFHLRRFDAAEGDSLIAGEELVQTAGGRSTHLLSADVDGDGLTDVIVSTRGDQAASVHVFRQTDVHE